MKKHILIITSSLDQTADAIMQKYNSMVDFFRFDVDKLSDYKISVGDHNTWEITNNKLETKITNNSITAIYYRKPQFPDLSEYEPIYHEMIQRDMLSLINGIADSFDGKVLSRPYLLRRAENKVYQLIYALKNNWKIPRSFIGNNSEKQKGFYEKKGIIKPLTTGIIRWVNGCEIYHTSCFFKTDEDISLTPIYLQDYIPKKFEVRITVINKKFYTIRIDTRDKLDWRKDYENHNYSIIQCPKEIQKKCLMMLKHYNLTFGVFDYIVTPQNDWIFLELNPNGQWFWLESELKLDISNKIINYLIGDKIKVKDFFKETFSMLKESLLFICNYFFLLWAHSPILTLTSDSCFTNLHFPGENNNKRLSLLTLYLGEYVFHFITFNFDNKEFRIMKKLVLSKLSIFTLNDKDFEIEKRIFKKHINNLEKEDLDIEQKALERYIEIDNSRIEISNNKLNLYSAIVLAVISVINFKYYNEINLFFTKMTLGKWIILLIGYFFINICAIIIQNIKVHSFKLSSFNSLKKSNEKEKYYLEQLYHDFCSTRKRAGLYVSYIRRIYDYVEIIIFFFILLFVLHFYFGV